MKNKLFLTSMVAVMLACPAYATLVDDPNAQQQSGFIASTSSSENCDSDPLTYQGTSENYGTYTLTAQWNVDQCTIELDPNVANGGASSNADPFATLYTTYNVGAYKDSARTNLMSTNSNGLSSAPIGKTVTLTANTNNPNSTNDITVSSGGTLSGQLPFSGFFSAATGGTQYISQTSPYYILSAGDTAAKGVNTNGTGRCPNTTWYAQYGCFQTTLPTASKPGYTFDGWWTTADNTGTQLNDGDAALCLTADDTVYAHWSGNKHSIIYQAGSTGCSGNNYTDNSTKPTVGTNLTYTLLGLSDTGITADTGYHFVEWGEDTLTSASYAPGASYTATPWSHDGDLMFTAKCAPNNYTITYNCNGGSFKNGLTWNTGTTGTDSATYGTTTYSSIYKSPVDTCQRSGYTLDSNATWTCVETTNNTTVSYFSNSASTWDRDYNMECTINWGDADTYRIQYECGVFPGTNDMVYSGMTPVEQTVSFGGSWTLLSTAPNACKQHASGYHFIGWYCDKGNIDSCTAATAYNGTANYPGIENNHVWTVSASGTYGCTGNVFCKAVWEANAVNVRFLEDEDDTTPYSEDSCQYGANGEMFDVPANPTKTGYTFTGWKVIHWDE